MKKFFAAMLMLVILFGGGNLKAEAAKDMGMTFNQFADYFAGTLDNIGDYSQYYVYGATLKTGTVKDVYQYNFHSNLSMLATVSHATGNVMEISFLASPQSEAQILEMVVLYGILMKTLNPELSNDQRNQLLRRVYCSPDNISELLKKNGKAIQGNVSYSSFFIESNGIFMLNASAKDV